MEARQTAPGPAGYACGLDPTYAGWSKQQVGSGGELLQEPNMSAQHDMPSYHGVPNSGNETLAGQFPLQRSGEVPPTSSLQASSVLLNAPFQVEVPLVVSGELSSRGSMLHEEGSCKPCLLFYSRDGCGLGVLCDYCHIKHGRKTHRPSKGKRDRFKRFLDSRTEQSSGGQ